MYPWMILKFNASELLAKKKRNTWKPNPLPEDDAAGGASGGNFLADPFRTILSRSSAAGVEDCGIFLLVIVAWRNKRLKNVTRKINLIE